MTYCICRKEAADAEHEAGCPEKEIARLRDAMTEAISYTETVDSLLDGLIPSRVNPKDPTSAPIYLKERLQMLIREHDRVSELVADCWIFLDALARTFKGNPVGIRAERILRAQKAPGWKE